MLTHIVLLRRRPGVSREPDYERTLVRRVRELKNRLANVSAWSVSANELERPASWEYALQAEFTDAGALDAFLSHPAYVQLLLDLKSYFDLAACYFTHV